MINFCYVAASILKKKNNNNNNNKQYIYIYIYVYIYIYIYVLFYDIQAPGLHTIQY